MDSGDFCGMRGAVSRAHRQASQARGSRTRRFARAGKAIGAAALLATTAVPAAHAAPPKEVVPLPSSPELGKAEGRCHPGETGPAVLVSVAGLKDRLGHLKLEVYPSNDADWLQDDNILLYHGKTFRRVEEAVPQSGPATLCIRIPGPGTYSVMLLHDRNSNHKFDLSQDGVGFAGNPHIGWGKPKAAAARLVAGGGLTRITIVLNYFHGLHMSPLHEDD